MIRKFEPQDMEQARKIHRENGLPDSCFPDLIVMGSDGEETENPLFIERAVFEQDGQAAMMCFLKVRSELYLLLDHTVGTPEERWDWLKEFKDYMTQRAWQLGLDQMTAFVPSDVDKSFRKRLEDLGFVRSAWEPYTLNVE